MEAKEEFEQWINQNYDKIVRTVRGVLRRKNFQIFDAKISEEDVVHSAILRIWSGKIKFVSIDLGGNVVDEKTKQHRLFSLICRAAISYVIDENRKTDAFNPSKSRRYSLYVSTVDANDDAFDDDAFLKSSSQSLESLGIYQLDFSKKNDVLKFIQKFVSGQKARELLFNEFFIGNKTIREIEKENDLPINIMYQVRHNFCQSFETSIDKELGISMRGYKYFSELEQRNA